MAVNRPERDLEEALVTKLRDLKYEYRPGREIRDEHLTSPWCQLEAGMALQKGIPLLVMPEPGIREGVFDPQLADRLVQQLELGGHNVSLLKSLNEWIDHHFPEQECQQAAVPLGSLVGGRDLSE
ncbi:hypothetical protein [Sulfitobacter brevis]|uniref:hypothetical protein n=1 Tax=Sulfitobacter brevis TaxID=74348 RepID=UPI001160C383|nr:hypothetical protein [Sulfitobacter brevis]